MDVAAAEAMMDRGRATEQPATVSSWGTWIRVIVTLGLVTGYFVAIQGGEERRSGFSVLANSILLPASLIWLWFL